MAWRRTGDAEFLLQWWIRFLTDLLAPSHVSMNGHYSSLRWDKTNFISCRYFTTAILAVWKHGLFTDWPVVGHRFQPLLRYNDLNRIETLLNSVSIPSRSLYLNNQWPSLDSAILVLPVHQRHSAPSASCCLKWGIISVLGWNPG